MSGARPLEEWTACPSPTVKQVQQSWLKRKVIMSTREVVIPRLWESSSELSAITARIQLDESLQRREADRAQVREVVARYGVNYQVVNRFFLSGLDSLDDICWAFASEDEVAEWVSRVPALRMPTLQAERCRVMWSVLRNIARGGPGVGMGPRLARRLEAREASDAVAEGVDLEAKLLAVLGATHGLDQGAARGRVLPPAREDTAAPVLHPVEVPQDEHFQGPPHHLVVCG